MRIFVYGTLKRNYCRHFVLKSEILLGTARTQLKYRMFNVGNYPALVADSAHGRCIQGEVWEVSDETLHRLDEVEGVDEGLYARRPIELETDLYAPVEAYFYLQSIKGCPDCGENWT